uniref:Uncharacterized protein LOC102805254 n=1 Tax=Saccoglossus kowalevskii TaxID=10224 RepID=A0ABM0MWC0_SACKO|nr:PREDICTED: uncharacterized protein LOC102805254 [Saccoglossus kowalevskii]
MEKSISQDGKEIYLSFNEVPIDYFDSSGTFKMWKSIYICQSIRYFGLQDLWMRIKGSVHAVKTQKLHVYPILYSDVKVGTKLRGVFSILSIGRTSICMRQDVLLADNGQIVCRCDTLMVHIDKKTRKPSPLLTEHLVSLRPMLKDRQQTFMSKFNAIPTVPQYVYSFVAPFSDEDVNLHINHSNYIKYCMDCASFGARDHAYPTFTSELSVYNVRSISVIYVSEAIAGNKLKVVSWIDDSEHDTIRFVISNEERDVFHCIIRFRKLEGSKL